MSTYLFVWNPKRWTWHDIENDIQRVDADGKCAVRWSCGNTKSIVPGDRMFLVKVGTEPKGIVAGGFVTTHPFSDRHWSGENKEALYIGSLCRIVHKSSSFCQVRIFSDFSSLSVSQ